MASLKKALFTLKVFFELGSLQKTAWVFANAQFLYILGLQQKYDPLWAFENMIRHISEHTLGRVSLRLLHDIKRGVDGYRLSAKGETDRAERLRVFLPLLNEVVVALQISYGKFLLRDIHKRELGLLRELAGEFEHFFCAGTGIEPLADKLTPSQLQAQLLSNIGAIGGHK